MSPQTPKLYMLRPSYEVKSFHVAIRKDISKAIAPHNWIGNIRCFKKLWVSSKVGTLIDTKMRLQEPNLNGQNEKETLLCASRKGLRLLRCLEVDMTST